MNKLLMTRPLLVAVLMGLLFGCTKPAPTPEKTTTPEAPKKAVEKQLAPGECAYTTSSKDITMEWTAFKFTNKAPVKGTFNSMTLQGNTTAKTFSELVGGLSLEIDQSTIESGNPGRNVTVAQFFFDKFTSKAKMKASVSKIEGDEKAGTLHIELAINGVSKTLPFAYEVKDNVLEAMATMQMMDFGLKAAFDSIHKTCKTLHTGEDGVAKTWDVVDLRVTGKYAKKCN